MIYNVTKPLRLNLSATGPGPSTLTTVSSMGTRAVLDRQIIPLPPAPTLNAAAWVSAARTQQFISRAQYLVELD